MCIEKDKMVFILALSSDHAQQGVDIKKALDMVDERIAAGHLSTRHENILRWLNDGLDPSKSHFNAWKKHQPTTGDWLIYGERYVRWKRNESQALLWLHGIPGCGKTVLCSTIINDLMLESQHRTDTALIYFYFNFNEADEQRNNVAMLRSLLGQLACQTQSLIPPIEALYTSCASGSRIPNEHELLKAFSQVVAEFYHVYAVIDALDEGIEKDIFPSVLMNTNKLHVLCASRHQDDIAQALRRFDPMEILANARIEDIRVHVKARLEHDPKLARLDRVNKTLIETTLVDGSDGMFRWVECQLDALRRCRTSEGLLKALNSLPKTLDETYERILQGIDENDRESGRSTGIITTFAWWPSPCLSMSAPGEMSAVEARRYSYSFYSSNLVLRDHRIVIRSTSEEPR